MKVLEERFERDGGGDWTEMKGQVTLRCPTGKFCSPHMLCCLAVVRTVAGIVGHVCWAPLSTPNSIFDLTSSDSKWLKLELVVMILSGLNQQRGMVMQRDTFWYTAPEKGHMTR